MSNEKRVVMVDDFEQRLIVRTLNDRRTEAKRKGEPTEDLDSLLIKVIDAPLGKSKRRRDHEAR